ncbi:MAG: metallophosphoesterase [Lachnospiraceae bacterium]|nr:metallophosphoesterase [Lachnospiraceae bacterium]
MNKTGVIILSDIHFTKDESKCKLCSRDLNYLTKFLTFIKKEMKKKNITFKYLLIAGDIVESGKRAEYNEIEDILLRILEELQIKKEHVLIVPGNHDLSRDEISTYCDQNDIPEEDACKYMNIKYKNYINFYNHFMNVSDYSLDKAIIGKLDFEECNISVLGVNSNVKESHRNEDHKGFIDVEKLMEETKYLDCNRHYLVLSHHSWADDRQSELPTIKNADDAKSVFHNVNITSFMYGHHHAIDRKNIEDRNGVYQYCEIGSFSKKFAGPTSDSYSNLFVTAVIDEKNLKLSLTEYIFFQNEWMALPDYALKDLVFTEKEQLKIVKPESSFEFMENPEHTPEDSSIQEQVSLDNKLIIGIESEKYLAIIAKDGLYKEGHYHWSNGEKARGWINISCFLGNSIILSNLRKDFKNFYDMILKEVVVGKIDAVIGYGMEGNIVGSALAPFFIKNDIRYLYCPSIHKDKNFINAEKIMWNKVSLFERLIFIFDFVPSDDYLKEIIDSDTIFENVKELYIFSIFSININENISSEILHYKMENDVNNNTEQRIRVIHFVACKLPVPKCETDMTQCPICVNHLSEITKI